MNMEALGSIDLLLLDVDGVLTDGSIIYDDRGIQIKAFSTKDGLGIRLLMESGVGVGILTGRTSDALEHRCRNLGISILYQNVTDKVDALDAVLKSTGVSYGRTAYMGDDLPDIPVMKKVGLPIAVSDAHDEVKKAAKIITQKTGGHGAVREIADAVLKAKNLWPDILKRFSL
ncbi:MAG: HAD hydrolase family protein [Desulfobacterales bacterium]